jgi:hypothetical protein
VFYEAEGYGGYAPWELAHGKAVLRALYDGTDEAVDAIATGELSLVCNLRLCWLTIAS